MRVKAPIAVSALVLAGLVTAGSSAGVTLDAHQSDYDLTDQSAEAHALAALHRPSPEVQLTGHVGIVPASPKPGRELRAATPSPEGAPFTDGMLLSDIALPGPLGAMGIPELVLAAYRNAELAMAQSDPGCGISWSLLAGIGKVESNHADGGRTDAAGTTLTPIYGPVLDGHLPGNEVVKDTNNTYERAIGPMQFMPGTWAVYASDGNGDGIKDPNNVFDATMAAAKDLCAGGLNLRDPAQELRAVLRYNNSMAYAANVLSWAAAYRIGGTPATVNIPPGLIPPGSMPVEAAGVGVPPGKLAAGTTTTTTPPPTTTPSTTPPTTTQQMINIPGLPPIPCGILCPPPPAPPAPVPTPEAKPGAKPGAKLPATPKTKTPPPHPAGVKPTPTPAPLPAFGLVTPAVAAHR